MITLVTIVISATNATHGDRIPASAAGSDRVEPVSLLHASIGKSCEPLRSSELIDVPDMGDLHQDSVCPRYSGSTSWNPTTNVGSAPARASRACRFQCALLQWRITRCLAAASATAVLTPEVVSALQSLLSYTGR